MWPGFVDKRSIETCRLIHSQMVNPIIQATEISITHFDFGTVGDERRRTTFKTIKQRFQSCLFERKQKKKRKKKCWKLFNVICRIWMGQVLRSECDEFVGLVARRSDSLVRWIRITYKLKVKWFCCRTTPNSQCTSAVAQAKPNTFAPLLFKWIWLLFSLG